jgi:hypothetical protein
LKGCVKRIIFIPKFNSTTGSVKEPRILNTSDNVAPEVIETPFVNVCNCEKEFVVFVLAMLFTAPVEPSILVTPIFVIVTLPVPAETEIPDPAALLSTPVFVKVTEPVAPDTEIPVPATAADTP